MTKIPIFLFHSETFLKNISHICIVNFFKRQVVNGEKNLSMLSVCQFQEFKSLRKFITYMFKLISLQSNRLMFNSQFLCYKDEHISLIVNTKCIALLDRKQKQKKTKTKRKEDVVNGLNPGISVVCLV